MQTVDYFKVLVLSGFGYPISALLVNVLSSRGKSKDYLRLEIYKKMLIPINMTVLYFYGVEAFLYFLILTSAIAVYLNIIFVSKEINIPKWQMVKPIIMQSILTVISVLMVLAITQALAWGLFVMFVVKGSLFVAVYVLLNAIFKVDTFGYVLDEVKPAMQKVKEKILTKFTS